MSRVKDFDSNFVSGAYEVNKERDKRRNRRMQKIKHKKEAEKLAKVYWHGGYYWKDEKRVGVFNCFNIIGYYRLLGHLKY